jgi:cytochrome P450
MDVIADLAGPLPVTVIAVMLGVPPEDHQRFRAWSNALALTLEPVLPAEVLYHAGQAVLELLDYFRSLVARKRAAPQDDLLSALIQAEEQGQRLSTDELLANAVLLLAAGHETTVNLIGNGTLALLRNPEQLALLRRSPGLIKEAVEELLRYDAPVQIASRILAEDVNLDGRVLRKGSEVLPVLGAANRDPAQFPDPDRLDLTRQENRHLSFGGGIHYCVGAPLARAEAQIAFGQMVQRFANLKLAEGDLEWRPMAVLRGLKALPVTF